MADPTYPPLDTPKPVADGIWIVDGGPHRMLGIPLPVRMSVVRLAAGGLWLHSPIHLSDRLAQALEALGPIEHLVAPSMGHWSYLKEWQRRYPQATTWAVPGLRRRPAVQKSGLRLDHDLTSIPPEIWEGEIRQALVPGAGFAECAFFHDASRTAILTDLIVNVEPEKMPALLRPVVRLLGVAAPDGSTPPYVRALVRRRREQAAEAGQRILDWGAERVVFAHGRWFERDGAAELRRRLSWLV
ncbi:MAG TPA: DUF4336 domain-containing protein [Beijerinckiaceae bacterium]|nr:DUF4336 domain-containing protein [Beijerinckiaceae bacterium]